MKKFIIIAVPLIVVVGIIWFASNKSQEPNAPTASQSSTTQVALGQPAPEAHFTALSGKDIRLSDFKGKKVMLWFLTTWCPSCIAGAQVLEKNNSQLGNLTVIPVENYGDAGYPGPSIGAFAKQNAPQTLVASNWQWGDASQEATSIYNPRNYLDIYFLIDGNGVIRTIDGAPAATIDKIIKFANE